jgi:hypothetical protein
VERITEDKICFVIPAGYCVALYAYESAEPGDLMFRQGDTIRLIKDEGDWWTGYLDDPNHTGVFPANYVEKIDAPVSIFFALSSLRSLSSSI